MFNSEITVIKTSQIPTPLWEGICSTTPPPLGSTKTGSFTLLGCVNECKNSAGCLNILYYPSNGKCGNYVSGCIESA